MHSEKEYGGKIRKLERSLQKSEAKVILLKETRSSLRQEIKYKTRRIKELSQSRDKWKAKNKYKSATIKSLEQKRVRAERVKRHHFPLSLIKLCVLLRLVGGCSYRKILSVLEVLSDCSLLKINRLPCPNTIQNWVSKIGLSELQATEFELFEKEVILIMDESIRIGNEKHLLVLSTPYEKEKEEALGFEDVKVVYFGGKTNWNGAAIQVILQEKEEKIAYRVQAILSDEDSKLKCACRLQDCFHLKDICHAIGTCLRKTFEKDIAYQTFVKELGQYKSKGVNQDLSYLLPPNQRTKSRFLNQAALVSWAEKMLERFEKLSVTEQAFFKTLPSHHSIITELKSCISVAKELSLPLKTKGLSTELISMIRTRIAVLSKLLHFNQSGFLYVFLKYLDDYMAEYQDFIKEKVASNIPVSSEVIESLLGKYKSLVSPNKITGTTKLNLEIPAQCRSKRGIEANIKQALESIFMTDLEKWIQEHSSNNQLIRRIKFFKNGV